MNEINGVGFHKNKTASFWGFRKELDETDFMSLEKILYYDVTDDLGKLLSQQASVSCLSNRAVVGAVLSFLLQTLPGLEPMLRVLQISRYWIEKEAS